MLLELYRQRLDGVAVDSVEGMIELLAQDEKRFYFLLMYYYLSKIDISFDIRGSSILSMAVTTFCNSIQDESIEKYYSKYVDLKEIPDQLNKIYHELGLERN